MILNHAWQLAVTLSHLLLLTFVLVIVGFEISDSIILFYNLGLPSLVGADVEVTLIVEIRQSFAFGLFFLEVYILDLWTCSRIIRLSNGPFNDLALLFLINWLFEAVLGHLCLGLR